MIEFRLTVDRRIIQAILPKLEESFSLLGQQTLNSFACPNPLDDDFSQAWEDGLNEENRENRSALARVFKRPGVRHGYVQVKEDETENILRGLSELRLLVRDKYLGEITDYELENGEFNLDGKSSNVKIGYFIYVLLAEIQENLISFCL